MAEIICIARGTATLGRFKQNADGTTTKESDAQWEPSPNGGSVGIFKMDADTNKVLGPVELFGDWQASDYLARVLELLGPGRANDLPPLKHIIRKMDEDGVDVCDYCGGLLCSDCVVKAWRIAAEADEE